MSLMILTVGGVFKQLKKNRRYNITLNKNNRLTFSLPFCIFKKEVVEKMIRRYFFIIILAVSTVFISSVALADNTTSSILGDCSRGNHPLAQLEGTDIIVPRPAQSQYPQIAVQSNSNTSFNDIAGHWAEDAIQKLVASGLITGYEDGSFRPNDPVTYAEYVMIVARLNLQPIRFQGGYKFYTMMTIDGSKTNKPWYYDACLIASEAGLVGSYYEMINDRLSGNSVYYLEDINTPAKRQYIALYLSGLVAYSTIDLNYQLLYTDISSFDHSSNETIIKAVKKLSANNIMDGYENGAFQPNGTITRAELATILNRILELYNWDKDALHDNLYGNFNITRWQEEMKLLELVSDAREAEGLNRLNYDPNLRALAQIKAIDFSVNDYFDHVSPTWGDIEKMASTFGYTGISGENISISKSTAQSMHGTFYGSAGHRENLLYPKHKIGGMAIEEAGTVQMFGK